VARAIHVSYRGMTGFFFRPSRPVNGTEGSNLDAHLRPD